MTDPGTHAAGTPDGCAHLPVEAPRALRILHVYRTGWPDTQGGTEEFMRTLGAALVRRGHEVAVLYPSRRVDAAVSTMVEGVTVWRVPELFELASCNVFVRGLGTFRRLAARADVVHYHFPWPYADLLHLLVERRPWRPSVLTYHSDIVRQRWLGRAYAPLMRAFLRSVDCVVATSAPYACTSPVLRSLSVPPRVIALGVDCESLRLPEPVRLAAWRERVGEGFFFFVGVLRYYKGLDVLLHAAAGTGLRVVIAGEGPEGPRLRALAQSLGTANVTFTGRVSDADKAALFTLSRAFVFPSHQRSEAYGIALLEALAWGRAAITADPGTGVGFLNRDGITGLNVPPGDAVALRAAMQRLADDDALCGRLGAAGRERARHELSATVMVDAYAALYRELYNAAAPDGRGPDC
jgi:rhamnosyl/mannosyltransferase